MVSATSAALLLGKKKKSLVRTERSGISPATIRWAFVTIKLCMDCRKISFKRTTGSISEAIRSPSTLPGPTLGSWSLSPTRIKRQPSGSARSTASKMVTSTMESSSITSASQSRLFFSFLAKVGWSFSSHSTCNKRWMVLASLPVRSDIRFAARPVGAAKSTFSPLRSKILMIALSVVVFPVPGPPVKINMPWDSALRMACFCISA